MPLQGKRKTPVTDPAVVELAKWGLKHGWVFLLSIGFIIGLLILIVVRLEEIRDRK